MDGISQDDDTTMTGPTRADDSMSACSGLKKTVVSRFWLPSPVMAPPPGMVALKTCPSGQTTTDLQYDGSFLIGERIMFPKRVMLYGRFQFQVSWVTGTVTAFTVGLQAHHANYTTTMLRTDNPAVHLQNQEYTFMMTLRRHEYGKHWIIVRPDGRPRRNTTDGKREHRTPGQAPLRQDGLIITQIIGAEARMCTLTGRHAIYYQVLLQGATKPHHELLPLTMTAAAGHIARFQTACANAGYLIR